MLGKHSNNQATYSPGSCSHTFKLHGPTYLYAKLWDADFTWCFRPGAQLLLRQTEMLFTLSIIPSENLFSFST